MFSDKALRAMKFGALYAFGFLAVMAALIIFLLPSLQLSRLAIVGLFFLSMALCAMFGIRAGFKVEK